MHIQLHVCTVFISVLHSMTSYVCTHNVRRCFEMCIRGYMYEGFGLKGYFTQSPV